MSTITRKRNNVESFESHNAAKRAKKHTDLTPKAHTDVSAAFNLAIKPSRDLEDTTEKTIEVFKGTRQKALLVTHFKEPLKLIEDFEVPEIGEYDVLVQNKAVGLNPIDWKGKKYGFGIYHFPWINGRESSGVIIKVGAKVDNYRPGDKVIISSTSYRDNRTSTFQEYTSIDSRLVWKLSDHLSFEDGATVGVGLVTAGVILYDTFGFKLTSEVEKQSGTLLLWGGSTIVGLYVIQLAKLHGLKVIAVSSSSHNEYLSKLGVDHIIDRHLTKHEIISKAVEAENDIRFGVDCVSKDTAATVAEILDKGSSNLSKEEKPLLAAIVGKPKEIPPSVQLKDVVIKKFHENIDFGKKFVDVTTIFLDNKQIQTVKYKAYNGGLHLIGEALKDLEEIGAKGEKYVVTI